MWPHFSHGPACIAISKRFLRNWFHIFLGCDRNIAGFPKVLSRLVIALRRRVEIPAFAMTEGHLGLRLAPHTSAGAGRPAACRFVSPTAQAEWRATPVISVRGGRELWVGTQQQGMHRRSA